MIQEAQVKTLCGEAATQLRAQRDKLASATSSLRTTQKQLAEFQRKERAFEMAKRAADRSIIDADVVEVEKLAKEFLASERSLDVIEEALEMALPGSGLTVKQASAVTGVSGEMDAISALLVNFGE